MNRRTQIELSPEEQRHFLDGAHTIILGTNGPKGFPQLTAMWFVNDTDGTIYMTTFTKSQKTKNLERDPRATLLVESGRTYPELKGLMITAQVKVIRGIERVLDVMERINAKYNGLNPSAELRQALQGQASKRVVLEFTAVKTASWDHSKLGSGVY